MASDLIPSLNENILDRPRAAAEKLLKGQVCAQYVRCGKAGCRCVDGKLHGPYHYRVWRNGDKIHKVYVRRPELLEVQAACRAYQDYCDYLRGLRLQRLALGKQLSRTWRRTRTYFPPPLS